MRLYQVFFVIAVAVTTMGCGKLTKENARLMIQEKHFKDNKIECKWKTLVSVTGTGSSVEHTIGYFGEGAEGEKQNKCVNEMIKAGVLSSRKCVENNSLGCVKHKIELGAISKMQTNSTVGNIEFACGTRSLDGINSITTEEKKAKVKFDRTLVLDEALIKALSDCTLGLPEAGKKERESNFTKDDDGVWHVVDLFDFLLWLVGELAQVRKHLSAPSLRSHGYVDGCHVFDQSSLSSDA